MAFRPIPDLRRRGSAKVRSSVGVLRPPKHANLFAIASKGRLACVPGEFGADWIAVKLKWGASGVILEGRGGARDSVLLFLRRAAVWEGALIRQHGNTSRGARSMPAGVLFPKRRRGVSLREVSQCKQSVCTTYTNASSPHKKNSIRYENPFLTTSAETNISL